MSLLDPAVANIALDAVSSDDFEIFAQAFLAHTSNQNVEPAGGMHDGGADGFVRPLVGKPTHWIQISTTKTPKDKIKQTIKRLKEIGREVDLLTYVTSVAVQNKDLLETDIERDEGIVLRIRDRRWITLECQRDETSSEIFVERFAPVIHSMARFTHAQKGLYSPSERMSILSYMEVHADSEPDEANLLNLAVDSAIYLALQDTDPDKKRFLLEDEIVSFVENLLPSVQGKRSLELNRRIARLSSKQGSPRIRYHKGEGYCLPFDVRSSFGEHSMSLRALEASFYDSLKTRCKESGVEDGDELSAAVEILVYALNKTFETQGLNLMASLNGHLGHDSIRTYEFMEDRAKSLITDPARRLYILEACSFVMRTVFYHGSTDEKEYLFNLFKAFSIEFVIRGDDSVATYFYQLARGLELIVGSDIIVRALSEVCLKVEHQSTSNALRMLVKAGAKLYLTEQVFDEVYHHVLASDKEFDNFYRPWEAAVTLQDGQQSDRILIRAYFYSKFEPDRHLKSCSSWDNFLKLFGSPQWFRDKSEKEGFWTFLLKQFDMVAVSAKDIESSVDKGLATRLVKKIERFKKDPRLAWNDAWLVLYVNRRREAGNERTSSSVYGYRTWWLTEEFRVLAAARELNIGSNLNMHPQFLMNLYAVSPKLRGLANDFKTIFPTNFGLKITHRVDKAVMHRFLESAVEAAASGDAASTARIRSSANKMLGSRYST